MHVVTRGGLSTQIRMLEFIIVFVDRLADPRSLKRAWERDQQLC
jgi:hypothetical protein